MDFDDITRALINLAVLALIFIGPALKKRKRNTPPRPKPGLPGARLPEQSDPDAANEWEALLRRIPGLPPEPTSKPTAAQRPVPAPAPPPEPAQDAWFEASDGFVPTPDFPSYAYTPEAENVEGLSSREGYKPIEFSEEPLLYEPGASAPAAITDGARHRAHGAAWRAILQARLKYPKSAQEAILLNEVLSPPLASRPPR